MVIEQEKILNTFKKLNIVVDLAEVSNNKKSFDERRAIAHNNYAIFIIEDLNNIEENYADSKKLKFLKKVEELLKNSAEFYKKANLPEEKIIEQCIHVLKTSLVNLETKINQIIKSKDSSLINAEKDPKPTVTFSDKKYREYQGTYSARLACKFFKDAPADTYINDQHLSKSP